MKRPDRRTTAALALFGVALAAWSTAALADRGPGAGAAPALLQQFDVIDADKDGKLTQAEIDAHRQARFAAADADKDGALSAEELAAFRLQEMQGRAEAQAGRMIGRMDKDGDGKLTAAEMRGLGGQGRMFRYVDADKDGAVSKAEAEAALDRMAGHRGKHGGPRGWWWGKGDGADPAD